MANIKVESETKERMDGMKLVPMETYDNIIRRLLDEHEGKGKKGGKA